MAKKPKRKTSMKSKVYLAEKRLNNRISRGLSKTYKTKNGNLVKFVNGKKYYYNRKLKKWVLSKYQK